MPPKARLASSTAKAKNPGPESATLRSAPPRTGNPSLSSDTAAPTVPSTAKANPERKTSRYAFLELQSNPVTQVAASVVPAVPAAPAQPTASGSHSAVGTASSGDVSFTCIISSLINSADITDNQKHYIIRP